jgi:hypothetical protein
MALGLARGGESANARGNDDEELDDAEPDDGSLREETFGRREYFIIRVAGCAEPTRLNME